MIKGKNKYILKNLKINHFLKLIIINVKIKIFNR